MLRTLIILFIIAFTPLVVCSQDTERYEYSDVALIMDEYCNLCHSNGEVGFKSNTYEGLLNSVSPADRYNGPYVIPRNAAGSPLIDKISNDDPRVGDRMPLNEEPVSEEEIQIIRDWINQGAVENLVSTSIDAEDEPAAFELLGNYPNPFNPSTIIRFNTAEAGSYRIRIYNINGRMVRELEGRASAGAVSVRADLNGAPSGTYLYRITLQSGSGTILREDGKMTLLR